MILVALGTQDKTFPRLIKAVEKQIELGNIKEEVIVQAGSTKYITNKMKIIDYLPEDEFIKLVKDANFVITHAGESNIRMGLKYNKKMIVAARLKKYKEHINDHQLQLLDFFAENGYIIPLKDFNKLDEAIVKLQTFKPKEFISNTKNFTNLLEKEIENLLQ